MHDTEVEFKDATDLLWLSEEGSCFDLRLQALMVDVVGVFREIGVPLVITSLYRDEGPGKIHDTNPLRAFDCRCSHMTGDQKRKMEEYFEAAWIYDTDRPDLSVLLHHDVGQGDHFHFQVHPNTIRRG